MARKLLGAVALACFMSGAAHAADSHETPGFVTEVKDGRLWVFKVDSPDLAEFKKTGEPGKQYTDIGGGPNGMTVKAADPATLQEYLAATKK